MMKKRVAYMVPEVRVSAPSHPRILETHSHAFLYNIRFFTTAIHSFSDVVRTLTRYLKDITASNGHLYA